MGEMRAALRRSRSGSRRWILLSVAVAAAAVAAACSPSVSGPRPEADGPFRYVSLGDSYVSGPLLPEPYGEPIDCGRSRTNWPAQVARAVDARSFVDVSCGSAKSIHMTEEQEAPLGSTAPPQFDALSEDTDLVTVGIGGNDVGFDGIAKGCVNLLPFPLGDAPWGRPCVQKHVFGDWDKTSWKIGQARPKVAGVLAGIRARAPQARVLLVGYPVALPDSGVGCWPQVPVLDVDVRYLRDKYREMNRMLAEVAAEQGAEFVDAYTPSIGHDVCQPYPNAWVNTINLDPPGLPLHPNVFSHRRTAQVVSQAVLAGG